MDLVVFKVSLTFAALNYIFTQYPLFCGVILDIQLPSNASVLISLVLHPN